MTNSLQGHSADDRNVKRPSDEVHATLAIHGGTPTRSTLLPYGRQSIDEADIAAVVEVLRSEALTQGPAVNQFEQRVAAVAGARYAVAFANGTAALHGACYAAGISPGDEVITSPMTFLASSNCVLYQGGTPVFADIRPDTYNINPDEIRRLITPQTKAIIAVDYTGQPAEMDEIMAIAREHGLIVIEDAAHSLGASYGGRPVGSIADMTMFSFHPVKHVTTGEGGVITTDNELAYQKLVDFRSHGVIKDPQRLHQNDGPWYYEMHELGYNYRITDIQAALGTSQLAKLPQFVARRRSIAAAYNQAFAGLDGITIPWQHPSSESSWHLYALRFDLQKFTVGRRELFDAFRAENIGVHVHYIPVYLQPYYRTLGYEQGLCPQSEQHYEQLMTFPIFPAMTEQDLGEVIQAVRKIFGNYSVNR